MISSSGSGFGRKGKSIDYLRGSAAQKLAIESLRNIANVRVRDTGAETASGAELEAIVGLLREVATPIPVAEVAERLQWDSGKAANALAHGGEIGMLTFFKQGDRTTVALAEA